MTATSSASCRLGVLIIAALVTAAAGPTARAQVSVDEASKRLADKLATRPATTQPSTEVDHLRAENLRLRERVMSLEQEVQTLKESLARAAAAAPTRAPTTQGAAVVTAAPIAGGADVMQKPLLGRWRGGDITTGSSYLLKFNADGTYRQTFVATSAVQTGQFRVFDGNVMEMWNDKWPEDKKHNQYHVSATPIQITLTPTILDGADVKTPRPLTLSKAD